MFYNEIIYVYIQICLHRFRSEQQCDIKYCAVYALSFVQLCVEDRGADADLKTASK